MADAVKHILLLIVGAVIGKLLDMFIGGVVIPSTVWLFTILLILIFLSVLLAARIIHQVENLQQRIGIRVMYVDRDIGGDRTVVFQRARQVIEQAQHHIFVLNSFLEESHLTSEEGRLYYEALLKKAKEGVEYKRIIQVHGGRSIKEVLQHDVAYLSHFHAILNVQEQDPRVKVELKHTKARYLTTFVLVDDTKLLWQVNEFDKSFGLRMRGIFIFDDPRQEITRHFRDFFDQMARHAIPVTREELPSLPPS